MSLTGLDHAPGRTGPSASALACSPTTPLLPFSSSSSAVSATQPAGAGELEHLSELRAFDGPLLGAVLAKRQVSPIVGIVLGVAGQDSPKVPSAKHNEEHPERCCRHDEEVHRHQIGDVVVQKRSPAPSSLRSGRVRSTALPRRPQQHFLPRGPVPGQEDPERPVSVGELRSSTSVLEQGKLLAKSEVAGSSGGPSRRTRTSGARSPFRRFAPKPSSQGRGRAACGRTSSRWPRRFGAV